MARVILMLAVFAVMGVPALLADSATDEVDALIEAIQQQQFIPVGNAVSDGVDPNQPGSKGHAALVEAVKVKDLKIVDLLLQYNALPNIKEPSTGFTPLHVAFEQGLTDIVTSLLKHGGDPSIQDKRGKTPRDLVTSSTSVRALQKLLQVYDARGNEGFEDPPGSWVKHKNDEGHEYYFNLQTSESRWTRPASCAWQRVEMHGHPFHYVNRVTGQQTHRVPQAICWRRVELDGGLLWYNWKSNHTQHETPAELPAELLEELSDEVNLRWHNRVTGELSWEDPRHHNSWRTMRDEETGNEFYYNVLTAESTWDKPEELSWETLHDDENKRPYYHNPKTGTTQWEAPAHLAWQRLDGEL